MTIPTINSQEFLKAFREGDYPELVRLADSFALKLCQDAFHDKDLEDQIFSTLTQTTFNLQE